MTLFDGNRFSQIQDQGIIQLLKTNPSLKNRRLLIIQIGENASSDMYVKLKLRLCTSLGIACRVEKLSATENLTSTLPHLIAADDVAGVIVQLPLPEKGMHNILDLIPAPKDLDVLSSVSKAAYYSGGRSFLPPVVRAFDLFVAFCEKFPPKELSFTDALTSFCTQKNLRKKTICVVGQGDLVGKPISCFAKKFFKDVFIEEHYFRGKSLKADYIVLSAGIPRLVSPEDINTGACVIDFGSAVVDGRTVGDLDTTISCDHLAFLSPSPKGAGPVVVRFLIMNLLGI